MDVSKIIDRPRPNYATVEQRVLEIMQNGRQSLVVSPAKINILGRRDNTTPYIALYDGNRNMRMKRDEHLIYLVRTMVRTRHEAISVGLIGTWQNDEPVIEIHIVWLNDKAPVTITNWGTKPQHRLLSTPISAIFTLKDGALTNPRLHAMNPAKRWQDWPRSAAIHGETDIFQDKLEERFGILEPSWPQISKHCPPA